LQTRTRGAEPPRRENKIGGRWSAVGRSRRVAMAVEDVVYYLHSDHLGSTVLTTDGEGRRVGEMRYAPYGATRWAWGSPSTVYRYTGRRWEGGVGLYDYRARWYDSALGRFVQPDTLVPEPGPSEPPVLWETCLSRGRWGIQGRRTLCPRSMNLGRSERPTRWPARRR